jgi:hypothetical protein
MGGTGGGSKEPPQVTTIRVEPSTIHCRVKTGVYLELPKLGRSYDYMRAYWV